MKQLMKIECYCGPVAEIVHYLRYRVMDTICQAQNKIASSHPHMTSTEQCWINPLLQMLYSKINIIVHILTVDLCLLFSQTFCGYHYA